MTSSSEVLAHPEVPFSLLFKGVVGFAIVGLVIGGVFAGLSTPETIPTWIGLVSAFLGGVVGGILARIVGAHNRT